MAWTCTSRSTEREGISIPGISGREAAVARRTFSLCNSCAYASLNFSDHGHLIWAMRGWRSEGECRQWGVTPLMLQYVFDASKFRSWGEGWCYIVKRGKGAELISYYWWIKIPFLAPRGTRPQTAFKFAHICFNRVRTIDELTTNDRKMDTNLSIVSISFLNITR